MDRIAERLSQWFGSTPFILVHVVWFALWYPLGGQTELLTLVVSLEAIFLALFILRAENVATKRFEESVEEDIEKSDEQLRILKRLDKRMRG